MTIMSADLEERMLRLERSHTRTRLTVSGLVVAWAVFGLLTCTSERAAVVDEVRAKRLVILDAAGRERVVLGLSGESSFDPRKSHPTGAGLILYDSAGTRRGGFTTEDVGAVSLDLSAPPKDDSAYTSSGTVHLFVRSNGTSSLDMIGGGSRDLIEMDARNANDGGVIRINRWDTLTDVAHVRVLSFEGDHRRTIPLKDIKP